MHQLIVNKLHEIEEKENVRAILAVESGSRAWGFASPDSDYDVRFIYVRTREDYLKLDPARDVFADKLRKMMYTYFSTKRSVYHYISMAEGNYRGYLKGDLVRAKKYFYVLRPILACRWILEKGTPPPMSFSELARAELPEELAEDIERLLNLKLYFPELKEILKIEKINKYLDGAIIEIKDKLQTLEEKKKPAWDMLNELFLQGTALL